VNVNVAYDSACSYSVNVQKRFEANIRSPRLDEIISRTRFTIDHLHVNDHIDKCMYLYSANFMENTAFFHGVGTEQYWAENNQLGPQTRQMNPGHRHDKINLHHGDWNFKKQVRLRVYRFTYTVRLKTHDLIQPHFSRMVSFRRGVILRRRVFTFAGSVLCIQTVSLHGMRWIAHQKLRRIKKWNLSIGMLLQKVCVRHSSSCLPNLSQFLHLTRFRRVL